MEMLNHANLNYGRCVDPYLLGKDLWDVVDGDNATNSQGCEENFEDLKLL